MNPSICCFPFFAEFKQEKQQYLVPKDHATCLPLPFSEHTQAIYHQLNNQLISDSQQSASQYPTVVGTITATYDCQRLGELRCPKCLIQLEVSMSVICISYD